MCSSDLVADVLDAQAGMANDRPIMLRNVTVDFEARTLSVDGRHYGPIEQRAFTFPILSGDAIFVSRELERIS